MGELPPEIAAVRARLARVDALMNQTREKRQAAILEAAEAARFHDPEDALALLGSQAGEPEQLVRDLAVDRPYLVRPTMNQVLRRAAGRED